MSTEQTTEEPRTPLVEFMEDALNFRLFPWQLEMVHRMERQLLAQGEEARRIEEQDERQDDAEVTALGAWAVPDTPSDEQPGRYYPRTPEQQEAITKIEAIQGTAAITIRSADAPDAPKFQGIFEPDGSIAFTVTRYPDLQMPPSPMDREWMIEEPNGERVHLGRGQVTSITRERDQA